MVVTGDSLYFINTNTTTGMGIYYLKDTSDSPTLIKPLTDIYVGLVGYTDSDLIYFTYSNNRDSIKIFSLNVSTLNQTLLSNFQFNSQWSYFENYHKQFNDRVIFLKEELEDHISIWITDGTPAGTLLLKDDIYLFHLWVEQYTQVNNKMVIRMHDEDYSTLYIIDGTNNTVTSKGLAALRNFRPSAASGQYFFYSDSDGIPGNSSHDDGELYQSELTEETTFLVRDLANKPNNYYFGSDHLTNVDGAIYFTTGRGLLDDGTDESLINQNPRLWKYEPPFLCEEITSMLKNTNNQTFAYPNPAKNKLYLKNATGKKVDIFNANGFKVYTTEKYSEFIDVFGLENGMYFITIEGAEQPIKTVIAK